MYCMSLELRVPPVGESISEVQLGDWLKQEGQVVRKDENLVFLESEKATLEFPSPAEGVLKQILKKTGQIARVGEVIGLLGKQGESRANPSEASAAAADTPSEAAGSAPDTQAVPPQTPSPIRIMPAAQRVLSEAGLSPSEVPGSGPGGRITKEDALKAIAARSPAPGESQATPPPSEETEARATASDSAGGQVREGEDEVVPMSPLRRTVARRLVEAQRTMAMLTTFNEIDMSVVQALRQKHQEAFTARHGVKLGFMSFFVKAVIEALKRTPQLNAEIRDQNIVYHHYFDIGVAIGGGKGLVVPVLRNAEQLSFAEIEKAIADLGVRAREGRIKPDELSGGTFTLSNGGIFGSLLSTPIINPPQSGILGMHTIQDRPVAVDGQVVIRPMMYVALTYDHRVVDGREAVTFLRTVKELIESPARILLEA